MNTLKLIVAWAFISLPLGWGVYKSIEKSKPLFLTASATDKKP